ncbi:hypothetical protein [Nonomuraea ceibae]|uniref:hypothetical protein n=1 Tax=Nonomuraea ceibae TaxID=1935170 RepID=UPI001C5F8D8A|nr:hypothetical protein [Nonomuraea ceibae]
MITSVISPDQYGINPYSVHAARYRLQNPAVTTARNVATFHLTRRRSIDDAGTITDWQAAADYSDLYITVPSLGVSFKQEVGILGKNVTLNTSHSEYQLFEFDPDFVALRKAERWPRNYVIDWIFTERPACGAKFHNWKVVAGGCDRLLRQCDDIQSLRVWDRDKGGEYPYSNRNDMPITVYSMFEPSSATNAIKAAVAGYKTFAPK